MQCKWCVIRVVVNDVKYYCFRCENLKGLDNNHIQNSFFLHFLTNISIFLKAHLISSGFCIWLSKALHISYLISWNLHCEIWFERKLSMVIIVIFFILQCTSPTSPNGYVSICPCDLLCSRRFQNVPKGSRIFQKVPEVSRMFLKVPECMQIPELACRSMSLHVVK